MGHWIPRDQSAYPQMEWTGPRMRRTSSFLIPPFTVIWYYDKISAKRQLYSTPARLYSV